MMKASNRNPTLMQMLMHALKGVCHERGEVRLHALKYLNKLMESNIVGTLQYHDNLITSLSLF